MDTLIQDFRYAVRRLVKNPGMAAAIILTLTIGVGANTAVFSLANWLVLRPLPGVDKEPELATIEFRRADPKYRGPVGISFVNATDLSAKVTQFSGMTGEFDAWVPASFPGRPARRFAIGFVQPNYFEVLGVTAQAGRLLTKADVETAQSVPDLVLSDATWRGVFRSDPSILGTTIQLGGKPARIVGVAAPRFQGTQLLAQTDGWTVVQAMGPLLSFPPMFFAERQYRGLGPKLLGRLAPGASMEAAQAELGAITAQLNQAYPVENANLKATSQVVAVGIGTPVYGRDRVRATLRLLLGISGILALISAANVANLLLFEAVRRKGEVAVRRALGASGGRLASQSVSENVLLGTLSAVASVLVAIWMVGAFRGIAIGGLPAVERVGIDARVILFAIATAVMIGIVVGVIVPFLDRGTALVDALKGVGTRGAARSSRVRQGLGTFQLAASFMLLVGALLLVRTLRNLQSVDLGFDVQHVSAHTLLAGTGYSDERYQQLMAGLTSRLGGAPGIDGVAFDDMAPFAGLNLGHSVRRLEDDAARRTSVTTTWISPGYFTTMGIPLKAGRPFRDEEIHQKPGNGENPVIVAEALGRVLYGSVNPVGRQFGMTQGGTELRFTVVGVAADSRWQEIVGDDAVGPLLYLPFTGRASGGTVYSTLLVKSSLPYQQVQRMVESSVAELAPAVPISDASPLSERVDRVLAERRLFARTVSLLSLLAVALAAVGLYALVAFSVAARVREFGIRMALGAESRAILDLVVRQSGGVLIGGLMLGLIGAFGLSRLIANRLFGVTALEPFVYLLAMAVLVLVALVASLIPARAATKVDPMVALRSE